jgi:hypothetical protein
MERSFEKRDMAIPRNAALSLSRSLMRLLSALRAIALTAIGKPRSCQILSK